MPTMMRTTKALSAITLSGALVVSTAAASTAQAELPNVNAETVPQEEVGEGALTAAEEDALIEEFEDIVEAAVAAGDITAEEAEQLQAELDGAEGDVENRAAPVIGLPVILACVGTVGLSTYQAYNGGDPVEYIAQSIIGCIPFGAAARPAVVSMIQNNRGAVANALKAVGASSLALALTGDSAQ